MARARRSTHVSLCHRDYNNKTIVAGQMRQDVLKMPPLRTDALIFDNRCWIDAGQCGLADSILDMPKSGEFDALHVKAARLAGK